MPSVLSDLYSGAATFGRIETFFGAFVATFVAIILIIAGYNVIKRPIEEKKKVYGKVLNKPDCDRDSTTGDYSCVDIDVSYKVGKKQYTTVLSSLGKKYKHGDNIKLYYDVKHPETTSSFPSYNYHIIGWILILIGLFVMIGSWVWAWVVYEYKPAAAVEGTASAVNIISSAL